MAKKEEANNTEEQNKTATTPRQKPLPQESLLRKRLKLRLLKLKRRASRNPEVSEVS